jgi:hypothetical protein
MNNYSKFLKNTITGLCCLFAVWSCELESESYDRINASIFPQSEADVDALVTAYAYGVFKAHYYDYLFNTGDGLFVVGDIMTDYGMLQDGWTSEDLMYVRYSMNSRVCREVIQKNYTYSNWISKMTLALHRIKDVPMRQEVKDRYNAELRLGRGWLAFLLYETFGPVVIADLETLLNPAEEVILPRLSEEDMQTFIETELTEAAKGLDYNYKKGDANWGRFTKGLANTVLLKFYMHLKQWDKAEAMGRELLKPEYGYDLVPEYEDIFTLANEKNIEIIYAAQCQHGYSINYWFASVLPMDYDFTPFLDGLAKWNGYRISWPFVNSFDPQDKRLRTIVTSYTSKGGVVHNEANDASITGKNLSRGALPLKYEIDPETTGQPSQLDWIVYRYADVLTLTAEAIVRNGNSVTNEAVALLNRVRTRSLPQSKAYNLSDFAGVSGFLTAVLNERGWELYYEGARRADLIRHGVYIEKMQEKARVHGQLTLIGEKYLRYPFPQSAIDESKGVIENNPGW